LLSRTGLLNPNTFFVLRIIFGCLLVGGPGEPMECSLIE